METLNHKIENRASFQERLAHLSLNDRMLVDLAYDLAKESHRPEARDSGERYFEHPRSVALILIDECGITDPDLIIADLLHDTGEDSATFGNSQLPYSAWKKVAFFRLSRIFNERVARIVIALTKPKVDGNEIVDKETADRVYFEGLVDDEAILLKECDRLHNLRTLPGSPIIKQKRIVLETEEKYYSLFSSIPNESQYKATCEHLLDKIRYEVSKMKIAS